MIEGAFKGLSEYPRNSVCGYREVNMVIGAAMLIRLSVVEREGYFDERYFCYGEEEEWCLRVADNGWRLAIVPHSVVMHRDKGTDTSANAVYYSVRNQWLLRERLDWWQRLNAAGRNVYVSARGASAARLRGDSVTCNAIVAGLWDGLIGRFGERGSAPPRIVSGLIRHAWPFRPGLLRSIFDRSLK
jgi:Glycosyltransferase like family 2